MKIFPKKTMILLFVIIVIDFFGCESKKETPKQKETVKQVYLFAEQETDTLMESVLLNETNIEFNNQYFLLKNKSEQGNLNFSFNLKTPRLFKFYSFKPLLIPYIIYVTPGDTISYKLENKIITFKGTNAAHYNFFKELYDLKLNYPIYNEELGISDFKKNIEIEYQKKIHFLEQYVKDEHVSDLFYNKIKNVFKFQYIGKLLSSSMLHRNVITNRSDYLNDINIKTFNMNNQDDNVYFHLALTKYISLVSEEKFSSNTYSREALEYRLDLINKNLDGKTKEYAITKMLSEFDKHLSTESLDYFQDKIKIYSPQINDKKYKAVLEQINQRLVKINNQLADKVFSSTLLNIDGTSITFKEILKNQGNKIKVIDFWASWCAPCIKEIKKSHLYRERLIKDKDIEFLYFSIDKNQEKWRKKVTELKEFGMDKNQYLIVENKNPYLRTFFNISSIPHYAILDNKNNVFLSNSPSPSDTIQFNNLIKKIEALELK